MKTLASTAGIVVAAGLLVTAGIDYGKLRGRVNDHLKNHPTAADKSPSPSDRNDAVRQDIGVVRVTLEYKWKSIGRGDIRKNDLGQHTSGRTPDARRCNQATKGLGAVCPDGDNVCHYKNVTAAQVANGGGKHPGVVYECVYE